MVLAERSYTTDREIVKVRLTWTKGLEGTDNCAVTLTRVEIETGARTSQVKQTQDRAKAAIMYMHPEAIRKD